MQITARIEYALRACAELAAAQGQGPVKAEAIATAQDIPRTYLEAILVDLRRAGLVGSLRGADGGYWLKDEPAATSLAEIIRAVDGPLANVRGMVPDEVVYPGPAATLGVVWVAVRAALRSVLDAVTLADLIEGNLPAAVQALVDDPAAWTSRWS